MSDKLEAAPTFLQTIQQQYDGKARVELEVKELQAKVDGVQVRPTRAVVLVKLLIGAPEVIGGEPLHPVEIPMLRSYGITRDGEMSLDDMFIFVMRWALDRAWPGASAALIG